MNKGTMAKAIGEKEAPWNFDFQQSKMAQIARLLQDLPPQRISSISQF